MRIRFNRVFNFTPMGERRQTTKYRPGDEATVKRDDGELVVALGAAEEIDPPARDEATQEPTDPKPAKKAKAEQ